MKFYKVVHPYNGRYFSALYHGEFKVEYIPGEFVKGKYPLFVYSDLISADDFAAIHDGEVWEVEVKNPRRQEWAATIYTDYDMFWKEQDEVKTPWWYRYAFTTPFSVYVADEVKLVKRIFP